ncbi:hypothetical protein Syun_026262 [Stephania yunnanensis]|uniref:Uncharacterized protein n=1 Tax=Stephania yunnanensis TaxID=152371 RepID=A0AAP0EW26_9MAGN
MPKTNNNAIKTARKPLKTISNTINGTKSSNRPVKEKTKSDENDDNVLDRLLLAHSDLSSLVRQIDELIVEALKGKVTSNEGKKEIKSFTSVLNDMHASLKSWFPRLQNSLSASSLDVESQGEQSTAGKTVSSGIEEPTAGGNSPELESGSQISPSPLVSWCNDHNVENGRQLFLLTPLPISKELSSKNPGLSRFLFERKNDAPSDACFENPSSLSAFENPSDDLLENMEGKPSLDISKFFEMECTIDGGYTPAPKFSKRERPIYLMTPCLKTSPPKSCILLEPSFLQQFNDFPKSSQLCGNQEFNLPRSAESSSCSISENLASKFPEHFEPKKTQDPVNVRKELEKLPDYFISPPKSCLLMEPATVLSTPGKQSKLSAVTRTEDLKEKYPSKTEMFNQEPVTENVPLVESTPMWTVSKSKIVGGKLAGENTLKRELWTKFEAASSNVLRFNKSVLKDTSTKGFLDKLEEVSSENGSPGGL